MRRLVAALPGNESFATQLSAALKVAQSTLHWRHFPDRETYLRIEGDLAGAEVLMVCTLVDPDPQFLRLLFAARTARELGAKRVTLIAPYLAYMRQDSRFHAGEALTSACFASLISSEFDAVITIDPHLHRYKRLSEIYRIETHVVRAAPQIARWIVANVSNPLVIGPDEESAQWVSEIAVRAQAPVVVLHKDRYGDRKVRVSLSDLEAFRGRTPVLVDDIVSTARTLIEAATRLKAVGFDRPVCVVVHPVFAGDAYNQLCEVVARVVSTDTITHESNTLSMVEPIALLLQAQMGGGV